MSYVELNLSLRVATCILKVRLDQDFTENSFTQEPYFHSHPKYEIHVVVAGQCSFVFDSGVSPCSAGTVVVIPPHLQHKALSAPDTEVHTISFTFSLESAENGPHGSLESTFLPMTAPAFLDDSFGGISRLMSIRSELTQREIGYYEKICGELLCLLSDIARCIGHESRPALQPEENLVEQIEAHIASSYTASLGSCQALADSLHLSARQLRRICAKDFNKPLRKLMLQTRMEIAAHRLKHTRIPMGQLAEQLGYSSLSSFSSAYKRHFGHSPSQDRTL
ncbi:MAG: AraC family transcriptional regulator [Paenibacillus sp.]|jgi:AraC-like DNA-binding protein/mannose-6-phosphate isomerase-like protein (cupin superfamily)|nr:AraC family transcriptional regulator [Paenibacillus sp.]